MDIKIEEFQFVNFFARFLFEKKLNICILILSGSMDTNPILQMQKKISNLISERKYDFIIDLSHVKYISSKGLGFLIYLMKYRKNFLYLSFPPEDILRPLKLLSMDDIFIFYHNPDELKNETGIPDEIIQCLKYEIAAIRDIHYHMRWMKILRDYLAQEEVIKEMQNLTPYIQQADRSDSITLPSEEKYACILYKFLDRIFSKEVKIDRKEVDDITVELIAKELMTNAVKHGYDNKKEGVIEANFQVDDEKIEIRVIDYGKGFTAPLDSHTPSLSTGLQLLKKIFDDVTISEAPPKEINGLVLGKGTMVKMTKYLKPKH